MNQLEKRIVGYPFWLSRQVSTVCMKARCTVNNFSYMCCMFINSTWAVTHRMQVWTPRFRRPSETLITNGHRCINHRLPPFSTSLARARLAPARSKGMGKAKGGTSDAFTYTTPDLRDVRTIRPDLFRFCEKLAGPGPDSGCGLPGGSTAVHAWRLWQQEQRCERAGV